MRLAILLLCVGLVLAQDQPLNPYNRLPNTQDQLNQNNRLPNQRLPYDWWQKLQDLLRPQDPNPDSVAQQLPLHQNNQLLDTQNQLNPNNRLPNTQHQQLSYDWWQKLQALLRPRPPRPDNDGTDQDSGAAPSNIQCGVTSLSAPPINHLIVGGKEAQPGQFPWQIALSYSRDVLNNFHCGASYITNTNGDVRGLTAAHCVDGLTRIFGTFNVHDRRNDNFRTLRASKVIMHKDYDRSTFSHDIAVLHFNAKVDDFKDLENAAPICPASTDHNGDVATVSGWGTTSEGGSVSEKLRYVDKKLLTDSECKNSNYDSGDIDETMLCAGETGKDACQGDSGGPLVVQNANNVFELQGVVSWGYGCARAGYPGIYADVPHHYKWIMDNI